MGNTKSRSDIKILFSNLDSDNKGYIDPDNLSEISERYVKLILKKLKYQKEKLIKKRDHALLADLANIEFVLESYININTSGNFEDMTDIQKEEYAELERKNARYLKNLRYQFDKKIDKIDMCIGRFAQLDKENIADNLWDSITNNKNMIKYKSFKKYFKNVDNDIILELIYGFK